MYCRNCSNEVSPQAIACPKCGVPPLKGRNFCSNCGIETHPDAIICVGCGVGLHKPSSLNIDTKNIVSIWSKYSYSNYIVILLLSLMTFINFKCGGEKVYNITGLNLAVGKERHYTETKDYGIYGTHNWDRKETIFSWDICAFYLLIITCLVLLMTSKRKRFKYAKNLSIAALVMLVEWFIVASIKISKADLGSIEASFGMGYWLTLVVHILSLILLSLYLKNAENFDIQNELSSSSKKSKNRKKYRHQPIEVEAQIEPVQTVVNKLIQPEPVEIIAANKNNDYEKKYTAIFTEKKSKLKLKHIIVGVILLTFIIGLLYIFIREKKADDSVIEQPVASTIRLDTNKSFADTSIIPNAAVRQNTEISNSAATETNSEITNSVSINDGNYKFCDENGYWCLSILIEGNQIMIKTFPGKNNTVHKNKNIPTEIISGTIDNGIIKITKGVDELGADKFSYENGVIKERNLDGGSNEYKQCESSIRKSFVGVWYADKKLLDAQNSFDNILIIGKNTSAWTIFPNQLNEGFDNKQVGDTLFLIYNRQGEVGPSFASLYKGSVPQINSIFAKCYFETPKKIKIIYFNEIYIKDIRRFFNLSEEEGNLIYPNNLYFLKYK